MWTTQLPASIEVCPIELPPSSHGKVTPRTVTVRGPPASPSSRKKVPPACSTGASATTGCRRPMRSEGKPDLPNEFEAPHQTRRLDVAVSCFL
ncbi:hypothetical protein [Archangium sp.]|uniref:hypothetical protein n=1 Tax=Archangium sp. TaxID=1872627 RepID=UPI002D480E06|nr:hypothetical protein [Archangium sp.]HYO52822.1 hypothetical protein [Archangium sp.]